MRASKIIIPGIYGDFYRLHRWYEPPVCGLIDPQLLSDEGFAWNFVRRLRMDHADWLKILHALDAITVNSDVSLDDSQFDIVRLAVQGVITFYPFRQSIDFSNKTNNFPVIKASHGAKYHFVPASVLLLSDPDPDDVKSFRNG